MDYPETVQLSTSRTFWNSHDPTLDPFDETLVSTLAPLEASCSSTFLFQATSSTCDNGGDSPVFKRPYQQTMFGESPEGGGESRGTTESYCINVPAGSTADSSQFSWFSSSPHFHGAQGVSAFQTQFFESSTSADVRVQLHHQGGGHSQDQFGTLNSSSAQASSITHNAQDLGHGSDYQAFLKPLMRQPSFSRPDSGIQVVTKQLNAKASWQSTLFQTKMAFDQRKNSNKESLGSPCSVISGITKVLQGVEPVSSDHMESFGPSTSSAYEEVKNVKFQETPPECEGATQSMLGAQEASGLMNHLRPKRKRSRAPKQGDEVESQRMTHIAVERNRRKQMNEHLAALRALMPGSYVQKGDQASIVGGAIEFVKELEHLLHCLQAQKRRRAYNDISTAVIPTSSRIAMPSLDQLCAIQPPFTFQSPQQRLIDQGPFHLGVPTESLGSNTRNSQLVGFFPPSQLPAPPIPLLAPASSSLLGMNEIVGEAKSDMASVEVKMVGSDQAMVKIMAPRRSGQLLRTVVALESLALTVMHTNITTVHHTVLYSFHVQISLHCRLNVDEVAAALHQTFSSLHSLQF
ncbi:uncharacterized protein [Physcomitrium patens]|uniref:BHLH domain-containing protein n=1 Tax=Physcomitrium patens TaxID=3218 RepID=A0A7I4C9Y2_PHYPA|nr:transcription factor FAMA-like isoform X1 [Physcomitrium patens]|eukprot:XP_024360529.1 transcription factor FAMA-like isoform X1 [Physcomitrella patens]